MYEQRRQVVEMVRFSALQRWPDECAWSGARSLRLTSTLWASMFVFLYVLEGLGPQHPGSRYSQLLRLLWDKVERKEHRRTQSMATLANPYRPMNGNAGQRTPGSSASVTMQESPAMTEMMGDFSWTDLDAIGNFAVNGNSGQLASDAEWWSGFLPTDSSNLLFDNLPSGMDDWNIGLEGV